MPAINRQEPNSARDAGSGVTVSKIESRVPSTVVPCVPERASSELAFEAVEEENENVSVLLALVPLPRLAKFCSSALLEHPTLVHEVNDMLLSTRVREKLP